MRLLRALVVETDGAAASALQPMLEQVWQGKVVVERATDVRAVLRRDVDVAFLDARVSERDARTLAHDLQRSPPRIRLVLLGNGAPRFHVFMLAQAGATAYLEHPFDLCDLRACIGSARDNGQRLNGLARCLVGEMSLKDAQHRVRAIMLQQALESSGGSRRSAARLLGVTRPAVQRMLREMPGEIAAPESERGE